MNKLAEILQAMSNSAASNVSGPVDGINWLLKKAGFPASDAPVMGSEWMAQRALTRPVPQGATNELGEAMGMIAPIAAAAKAPQIAKGLLQAGYNLAAPQTLSKQAGMIKTPFGRIPETRGDVNKLADRFSSLLDDAGVKYQADKSGLSPARYFTFDLPPSATHSAEDIAAYGPEKFKARISDHVNVHGATFSVDPHTGSTFEQLLQSVRDAGIPLANKVKPRPKVQAPKSLFFGAKASEINALRQSRGGALVTPDEIRALGLVDDLGLTAP